MFACPNQQPIRDEVRGISDRQGFSSGERDGQAEWGRVRFGVLGRDVRILGKTSIGFQTAERLTFHPVTPSSLLEKGNALFQKIVVIYHRAGWASPISLPKYQERCTTAADP